MSTRPKRLNVLVYAGTGATTNSVRHAIISLRRLLGANYAVLTVTGDQILKEPWAATCALLVFPGGADLGYCRTLDGEGNRKIKQYVRLGGAYLGFCAGGYYGSARCEFEVGRRGMEVVGDRELAFFPGVCRGLAFPGFVYQSEQGARAVSVRVNRQALGSDADDLVDTFCSYYNGGGAFVDVQKFLDDGVEVLASYCDDLAVDAGSAKAAVVFRSFGDGRAILTGPHPEFSGFSLNPAEPSGGDTYPALVDALIADDRPRTNFMKACLAKLGLHISEEDDGVPLLSPLHLSAANSLDVSELVQTWHENAILTKDANGQEYIKGENDTFRLQQHSKWNMSDIAKAVVDIVPPSIKDVLPASGVPDTSKQDRARSRPNDGTFTFDGDTEVKDLVVHEASLPDDRETPRFNHPAFFAELEGSQAKTRGAESNAFGRFLMYGDVVTSTSTMLEKNSTWLSHLPIGFTATATTQVAGRGRGTNVWVSPPGSLMFSTVLRHALSLSNSAPVVFVQYLVALAIVAAIQSYDRGYDRLPVRLKWPNDIYALDPTAGPQAKSYVKIGGILVNSSYAGGDYTLVVGVGLNVNNSAPSVSLSQLARAAGLPDFTIEKLLAAILVQFEALYMRFCRTGFDAMFENRYYGCWLHTDQVVTVETEGGAKARIKGITRDWGQLIAEELSWDGRATGRRWELQSDSNSFDFFKGLLKRKT